MAINRQILSQLQLRRFRAAIYEELESLIPQTGVLLSVFPGLREAPILRPESGQFT